MTELGDCYTWSLSGTMLDSLAELHSLSTFFPKSKFSKKDLKRPLLTCYCPLGYFEFQVKDFF